MIYSSRMSKVDDILGYKKNDDEDFYKILGCDESSTVSFNFVIFHQDYASYFFLAYTILKDLMFPFINWKIEDRIQN